MFKNLTKMKHNILITGEAGFIGSHLVLLLINKYLKYLSYNSVILAFFIIYFICRFFLITVHNKSI